MTVRHLCLGCADAIPATPARGERNLNYAAILMAVGFLVLVISAAADYLQWGQEGFGSWQAIGTFLGLFLVLIGTVTRIATLSVIGLFTVALTTLADWVHLGRGPGFGGSQILGCCVGGLVMLAGLALVRRRS